MRNQMSYLYLSKSSCMASATVGKGLPLCSDHNGSLESKSQVLVFAFCPGTIGPEVSDTTALKHYNLIYKVS